MTYLLPLQLLLQHRRALMQPAKPVNLLLVLAADFVLVAAAAALVFPRELGVLAVFVELWCGIGFAVYVWLGWAGGTLVTYHAWVDHGWIACAGRIDVCVEERWRMSSS